MPHGVVLTPSAGHTEVIAVAFVGKESPETEHKWALRPVQQVDAARAWVALTLSPRGCVGSEAGTTKTRRGRVRD